MVKKKIKPAQKLIDALTFAKNLYKKNKNEYCCIDGGFLSIESNRLMLLYPVEEDVTCYPHVDEMLKSLKQLDGDFQLKVENLQLKVESDGLIFSIPCLDYIEPYRNIDEIEPNAILTDDLKESCKIAGKFSLETGLKFFEENVLLQTNKCVATDSASVVESYQSCP